MTLNSVALTSVALTLRVRATLAPWRSVVQARLLRTTARIFSRPVRATVSGSCFQ